MKQKISIVCLLLILVVLMVPINVGAKAPGSTKVSKLRILTINVWSGLDYKGTLKMGEYELKEHRELRFKSLVTQIRVLDPDVIFIQEANPAGKYSKRLAASLSFDKIHQVCNAGIKFGPLGIPINLKEGMVILARPSLQLEKFDVWKLSGSFGIYGDFVTIHFDESIFAIAGKIRINDMAIYLINVHLHSGPPEDPILKEKFHQLLEKGIITENEYQETIKKWNDEIKRRRLEVKRLLSEIKEFPDELPLIAAGDFNAPPNSQEILEFKTSGGFFDSYTPAEEQKRYTWDPKSNINIAIQISNAIEDNRDGYKLLENLDHRTQRKIDYIFLSEVFKQEDVLRTSIVLDSQVKGVQPSDHYGILAEIDVTNVSQAYPKEFKVMDPSSPDILEK